MSDSYENFRAQFPKYQLNGLACKDGVVQRVDEDELTVIGKSADVVYYRFWGKLKEGMTLDECYDVWNRVCCSIYEYNQWHHYLHWNPSPMDWWQGPDGKLYHIKNGTVCALGLGEDRARVPCNTGNKCAFEFLQPGMSLQHVRDILSVSLRGAKRWKRIYEFCPTTKHRQPDTPTRVKSTASSGYNRDACPPLISTTQVDVRILYPENDVLRVRPDQVQVILYALTSVWEKGKDGYKYVSPEVKKRVNDYFKFAKRQMVTCKELRENKDLLNRLTPKALRVTRDCCIECDFGVRRETDG